ncbi:5,10-methylenetetrahydromethanopterin reductase [Gammaproteobacteria bacterium]|nr:LLM class flavin-dependent oxidoreductase [Gammaproteobacteria bacterium]CAG0944452.1 5,10-methylenetetrahydromethanopterin reductase [Gammaproteobacteria bacterium]
MDVDVILDSRAAAGELAALGELAERCGIGGVWVSSLNDSRDPWANLVPVAQCTRRITLGPIAVNPYDTHPLKIASSLLTLNELAGGRARVIVGGGGEALQALGLAPERRVRAVRECAAIIRAAASREPVEFRGGMFEVSNCRFGWASAPAPPVYIGAGQAQMLRMAAAAGDGIMMSDVPPGPAARLLATLDAALAACGKSRAGGFWTSVFTAWHVYADEGEARREARRWLFLRGIFRPWLLAEFLDADDVRLVMDSRAAFARAFAAGSHEVEGVPGPVLDALVDNVTLCGTPATLAGLVARLRHLQEAGLRGVALRLYAQPAESIRLIGEQVLPALR